MKSVWPKQQDKCRFVTKIYQYTTNILRQKDRRRSIPDLSHFLTWLGTAIQADFVVSLASKIFETDWPE